jgi:hypothetical protein
MIVHFTDFKDLGNPHFTLKGITNTTLTKIFEIPTYTNHLEKGGGAEGRACIVCNCT